MFYYISGQVAELQPNLAVVDCAGIGFEINISGYTFAALKVGEKTKLLTYVHMREGVFEIYGFADKNEKRCFTLLLGVSGVGPKAALSILSVAGPDRLAMAIITGDEKTITAAPGVGKRIAQRIMLELKDKLAKENPARIAASMEAAYPMASAGGKRDDAAAALAVLGYSAAEVSAMLKNVDVEAMPLEDIIKTALRQTLS